MLNKEQIKAGRDELMERRDELMERAQEIRERFQENVDRETVKSAVGWTLVSGGVAFGVTQYVRGRRDLMALLLPIALIAGGAALLGGSVVHRRISRISDIEAQFRAQLSRLDPMARVQVLRDIRGEFIPFVRHFHN